MNSKNMVKNNEPLIPQHLIHAFLFAWFLSSGIMILLNINNHFYLSLAFSGFKGLIPMILILSISFIGLFLITKNRKIISNAASMSFLFLLFCILKISDSPYIGLGLILLTLLNLLLNRSTVVEAVSGKKIFPKIFLILNTIFIYLCYKSIHLYQLFLDIQQRTGIEEEKLIKLIIALAPAFLLISLITYIITLLSLKSNPDGLLQSQDVGRRNLPYLIIFCVAVIFFQSFMVSRILVARYEGLMTTTYDFNLFIQMFHSMARDLSQMTTLERNKPISHFGIHVSPIFYLMLPIFKIFPNPSVLQIMQALIVASGVIPALLLARHFKLSNAIMAIIAFIFMLNPAFIGSSLYDLHENCFLVPLILWTMYFIETEKNLPMAIFILLTLMVKEDAALYVWAIALFLALDKRQVKKGITVFIFSAIYFLGTAILLKNTGEGPMTGRFTNMMSEPSLSLVSIILTIFRNPGYVLNEIFTFQKIAYLIIIFLPLGLLPLVNRRYSLYSLMVPLLIMNLISDYQYQADIQFQYNYGSSALLFFLAIYALKDLGISKVKTRGLAMLLTLAIVSSFGFSTFYLKANEYMVTVYEENKEETDSIKKFLDTIPKDKSVLSSPYLTGYLADRKELYDIEYNYKDDDYTKTDYIVLDYRHTGLDIPGTVGFMERISRDGYNVVNVLPNSIILYKKQQ